MTASLYRRQRGVALLAAVLVVALATVLIAGLLDRGRIGHARATQFSRTTQAYAYQQGLELWAARLLRDDLASGSANDHLAEPWAQPMPPIDIPDGRIFGAMRDLDGCLNLNALWSPADDQPSRVARARFARLLVALELDANLLDAVVDWLDSDDLAGSGGGETARYAGLTPPRRPANGPFAHVSELRGVFGIDPDRYERLAPHVCARPDRDAEINVNTATAPVLMSLADGIGPALARRLHRDGRASYNAPSELVTELAEAGVQVSPGEAGFLRTSSRYFVAEADILQGDISVRLYSLIDRHQGIRVLARSQGRF
jgi:general secretion pathway protein K